MRWFLFFMLLSIGAVHAQEGPEFRFVQKLTNQQTRLQIAVPLQVPFRVEASDDLRAWAPISSLISTNSTNLYLDSATPFLSRRFYRAAEIPAPAFPGDHIQTDDGEVIIRPIDHASFVLKWKDLIIYNDPAGTTALYQGLPPASLVLISHEHGDHFNTTILTAIQASNARIIAPREVFNRLSASLRNVTTVFTNGASTNLLGLTVEAVPAYNSNHSRGVGNGYILSIGGKRFYMSGDTADTPEMRALPDIDVAFLCMNTPFTMTVQQAASAARAFRPKILYPYHYRNQGGTFANLNTLRSLIGHDLGIEVRERKWY